MYETHGHLHNDVASEVHKLLNQFAGMTNDSLLAIPYAQELLSNLKNRVFYNERFLTTSVFWDPEHYHNLVRYLNILTIREEEENVLTD